MSSVEDVDDVEPDEVEEADGALIEAFGNVLPEIEKGTISWADLAQVLSPDPVIVKAPNRLPVPAVIDAKVQAAIKKLPAVFGKVVPTEKRVLLPDEVSKLIEERDTIDALLSKMAERKEAIRLTALNHFQTQFEDEHCCAPDNDGLVCMKPKGHDDEPYEDEDDPEHRFEFVPRNPDGYFTPAMPKEKWTDPGDCTTGSQFSWERKENTKADISVHKLLQLADDESNDLLDHKDWLSMTRQERVFDPAKAMLAVRRKPRLIRAIAEATKPGTVSAQFWIRKAK